MLSAIDLMQRETRITAGRVPHSLGPEPLIERNWQLVGDSFLMRAHGSHWLYYRREQGVTIERGSDADLSTEPLWLAGTMHAAIACMNGLVPLHASAVTIDGAAFAFTGPSGAGKSTLAAALGTCGLPMLCDDTLVCDPAADPVACLPGHKRLKLTPEAVLATGVIAHERVAPLMDKVYATPHASHVASVVPLAHLYILEDGDRLAIEPVAGGVRMLALMTDHYTVDLLSATVGRDPAALFARIAGIASRLPMSRLIRPRDLARLDEVAEFVADALHRARTGFGVRQ